MFKKHKNKSFNFSSRYYDETKERIKELKEGKKVNIKFKSNQHLSFTKGRTIRLTVLIRGFSFVAYLLLFQKSIPRI